MTQRDLTQSREDAKKMNVIFAILAALRELSLRHGVPDPFQRTAKHS